jgi:hypothetical protein
MWTDLSILAAVLGASLSLSTVAPGAALAAPTLQDTENERFTIRGTLLDVYANETADFHTSSITGEPTVVTLDLSWIADQGRGYVDLESQTPIAVLVEPRDDGTYRAILFLGLAHGSQVNQTDWGVEEELTTRDDSINARTDNGPDDDEARAQGGADRTGGENDGGRTGGGDE